MKIEEVPHQELEEFQCSSASRKFLNWASAACPTPRTFCFSALQRAENSSITAGAGRDDRTHQVSVLFSEPKIPQCSKTTADARRDEGFSALQRAENSSIWLVR